MIDTANILIATSKEAINKFMSQKILTKSLLDLVSSEDNVLLFSNRNNSNFIEFRHSFGVETDQSMELTFIDPKNEFEKRFFKIDIFRDILGYFTEQELLELNNNSLGFYLSGLNVSQSDFNQKYSEAFNNKVFYIAYGSGNKIQTWSGPHKVYVTGSKISLSEGKKITLKLTPYVFGLAPIKSDLLGRQQQKFTRGNDLEYTGKCEIFFKSERDESFFPVLSPKVSTEFKDSYHMIITEVIRNYIQVVTNNPNVIVLLPNLDYSCFNTFHPIFDSNKKTSSLGYQNILSNLNNILSDFGINVVSKSNAPVNFLYSLVNTIRFQEKAETKGDRFKLFDTQYFVKLTNITTVDNHNKLLRSIIDKINEVLVDYKINLVSFSESNLRILEVFNKYKDQFKLNKWSFFSGLREFNPNKEVLVFGDVGLIYNLLYAQKTNTDILKAQNLFKTFSVFLNNEAYKRDIQFAFSNSQIPDVFAYKDEELSTEQENAIDISKIPIFRYNTKNPNVLNIESNIDNFYLTELLTQYTKNITKTSNLVSTGIIDSGIDSFKPNSLNELIQYLITRKYSTGLTEQEKAQIISKLKAKIPKELLVSTYTDEQFVRDLALLLEKFNSLPDKSKILITELSNSDPMKVAFDLFFNLYSKQTSVSLKTLPLFSLFQTPGNTLNKNCILFAQNPQILQSNQNNILFNNQKLATSFLSGFYRIIGLSNTITPDSAFSEFFLIKNV